MVGTQDKEQAGWGPHLQLEPNGQLEVQLHSGALELALQGVKDGDVDLGPVERTVRGVELHANRTYVTQSARSRCLPPVEKHS